MRASDSGGLAEACRHGCDVFNSFWADNQPFRQGRKFKMKSIISIASVAALSLALAACGAEKTEEAAAPEATAEGAAEAGMEAAEAAGDAAAEATEAAGEATEAAAEGAVDAAEAGADKAAAAAGEAKDAAKDAAAAAGEAAKK